MQPFDPEAIRLTPKEYKAIKHAARRPDGQIVAMPDMRRSPLWQMEGLVPDGYGGLMRGEHAMLVITAEGRRYVKWHKRQTAVKWWGKIKGFFSFWIPVSISIIALIVSIIALREARQ